MHIPIKTIAATAAGAVVSYHFSAALDLLGAKEHFDALMGCLPAALTEFIARKWVLAFSTFILGMTLADWMIRRAVKTETKPDSFTGIWLNHKKRMLLLGLGHPRFVPIDLHYDSWRGQTEDFGRLSTCEAMIVHDGSVAISNAAT